jgi:hypothetical protein
VRPFDHAKTFALGSNVIMFGGGVIFQECEVIGRLSVCRWSGRSMSISSWGIASLLMRITDIGVYVQHHHKEHKMEKGVPLCSFNTCYRLK